jgi:hypothetical protein
MIFAFLVYAFLFWKFLNTTGGILVVTNRPKIILEPRFDTYSTIHYKETQLSDVSIAQFQTFLPG